MRVVFRKRIKTCFYLCLNPSAVDGPPLKTAYRHSALGSCTERTDLFAVLTPPSLERSQQETSYLDDLLLRMPGMCEFAAISPR